MKKFTINEFRAEYPNDDACLEKIFHLRFNNLICPKCESDKKFTRVKNRRSYQCPCCAHQIYPTQGTVFEKTRVSLMQWCYANILNLFFINIHFLFDRTFVRKSNFNDGWLSFANSNCNKLIFLVFKHSENTI